MPHRRQRTLAEEVALEGTGLHTGRKCRVVVKPAEEDFGIVFRRDGELIPANVDYVVGTSRSTTLGKGDTSVRGVEHIMAALSGVRVDNAAIEVDGAEIPAFDGSALPICQAIKAAGIVEQSKPAALLQVAHPIRVESGDGFIVALPAEAYRVRYYMSYDHPLIGDQSAEYTMGDDCFCEKVAPARTFVLYEEVEALRKRRLGRGGSLDNVIVIWPDRMSSQPRMSAELSVHKLLDVIGDLSLIGRSLLAEVVAVKSGHALNVRLARKIVDEALGRTKEEHSDA